MTERWRHVPGWKGYYLVSDLGRVHSADRVARGSHGSVRHLRGKVLTPTPDEDGRQHVNLCRPGKQKSYRVHRLVMAAFHGPGQPGQEVCHWDGDASNNTLGNLRYDDRGGNLRDAVRHGTHHQTRKTHCPFGHLLQKPNLVPRELKRNRRYCLACSRSWAAVSNARKRRGVQLDRREIAAAAYDQIMGVGGPQARTAQ